MWPSLFSWEPSNFKALDIGNLTTLTGQINLTLHYHYLGSTITVALMQCALFYMPWGVVCVKSVSTFKITALRVVCDSGAEYKGMNVTIIKNSYSAFVYVSFGSVTGLIWCLMYWCNIYLFATEYFSFISLLLKFEIIKLCKTWPICYNTVRINVLNCHSKILCN